MNRQFQQIGALALSIGWLFFSGCAADPAKPTHSFPPPPTEAVRAGLGTIIVESATMETKAHFAKPDSKGEAAAKGALEGMVYVGAAFGHGSASGSLAGPVMLLEIALLPIGAAVGGVAGTFKGTPKAEITEAERVLAGTFAGMDFQSSVGQHVLEAGRSNTRHPFMTADEHAGGPSQPASILQIAVLSAGLAGRGEKNAPLTMFLKVQVRLLKSSTEPPIYTNIWVQTSGARPFNGWVADEGRVFREELPKASRAVAESIIEEIFLSYRPGKT
jgi:hypothetical protein